MNEQNVKYYDGSADGLAEAIRHYKSGGVVLCAVCRAVVTFTGGVSGSLDEAEPLLISCSSGELHVTVVREPRLPPDSVSQSHAKGESEDEKWFSEWRKRRYGKER